MPLDLMRLKIEITLFLPVLMTLEAVAFQDRQDVLVELYRRGGKTAEKKGNNDGWKSLHGPNMTSRTPDLQSATL